MPSNRRKVTAISILVVYLIILSVYVFGIIIPLEGTISVRYNELTQTPKPYTFQIKMPFNLSNVYGVGLDTSMDVIIGVTFTLPNGTLVANEPVDISSTVALRSTAITRINYIDVVFQNCLTYPKYVDAQGVPVQGILTYNNPVNAYLATNATPPSPLVIGLNTKVYWSIDGDYKPVIEVFFFDGTNLVIDVNSVVLHVYPQEQLTQYETERISLETNQASLRLSEAVLVLSTVSILALSVQIWDHPEKA